MKVGVYLEEFSPHVGGGYTIQEDVYRALLELKDQTRHSFVVFCRRPEELPGGSALEQIQTVAFPGTLTERAVSHVSRKAASLREKRKAQNRLEQIAHDAGVEFMWFVGAEAVQLDIPYLAIVWDLQHRLQPWFPEVSAGGIWEQREGFYRQFLRRAAFIIAGTDAGRAEIERFYQVPPDRVRILPHPTPRFFLEASRRDPRPTLEKYGLQEGFVLYPAQFWSHKNHANLLYAGHHLREAYQLSIPLVFVGSDKGNENYVRQLAAKLDLTGQVHFLGFVPVEDLIDLYRTALALAYVTFFGPENLPPLEAFAIGCPVIASNVSGANQQLGDAALLVDPKDPQQIATAIKAVNDDAQLRGTLIERGRTTAARWTSREFVQGVFSILDEFAPIRGCWDL
jgi:glycosyltransferase involved in cell wall biosynthesis